MAEGDVSTIFVAGLPMDAQPRELENMMRFFVPGYEGVKIAGAKGGKGSSSSAIFVKFDHSDNAIAAMKVLNNQPFDLQYPEQLMRVEMARSDMKKPAETVPRGGAQVQAFQPPPPRHAHPVYQQPAVYQPPPVYHHAPAVSYAQAPPAKRQRTAEDAGSVDTIAIFGALEKGFTEYQLEEYFSQLPGFICFKGNARNGGGFVKFASPHLAQDAIEAAVESGLECRMARTSMSSPGGEQGADYGQAYQAPVYEAPPKGKGKSSYNGGQFDHAAAHHNDSGSKGGGGGKSGKGGAKAGSGAKRSGGADGVDTLILQGVTEKGWTTASLTDLFQKVSGYVLFKANPRVGGGFVKFTDPESARDAIAVAQDAGIDAQMARSSMNA